MPGFLPAILVTLLIAPPEPIPVEPGPNAISLALKTTRAGDVIRLAPGAYTESVDIPAGVSLEGAGADSTFLVGVKYEILKCDGENRISGISFVGTRDSNRGIDARGPVRVERCVFDHVNAPVLLSSPLSDVVACDFIGSWDIREVGCATIWGCQFTEWSGLEGDGLYVRNCVFWARRTAISNSPIRHRGRTTIRNNLFHDCPTGIHFWSKPEDPNPPFIHNNIFGQCHIAVEADMRTLRALRDNLVDRGRLQMLRDERGRDVPHLGMKGIVEGDVRATLADGTLAFINPTPVIADQAGRARSLFEFGPERDWRVVGSRATASLPPIRFGVAVPLVNSEYEEELIAKRKGVTLKFRERDLSGNKPLDRLTCERDGERVILTFDITRIVEEEKLAREEPPK